jgi:hypothetical protein
MAVEDRHNVKSVTPTKNPYQSCGILKNILKDVEFQGLSEYG